ncbi:odorant receptor 10a-like, partial [Diachasma alloeum]|uniref:odorant receptor 10a-like n=1 Tax=Diachasma alloeum TaxID=454923 RepID=UPI0010FB20F5
IIIHHRAITLAESIETSFTIMNGIVVLLAMILISITGLEIIIKMDEPVEVIRYATFAGGVILHLLFISLPGQELSDHSSQVSEGIYSCNWSAMSLKAQRLISIMLMRSMKPMQMTAAKFYPQNLESFGKVLKTSFSFFTVMLSNR